MQTAIRWATLARTAALKASGNNRRLNMISACTISEFAAAGGCIGSARVVLEVLVTVLCNYRQCCVT